MRTTAATAVAVLCFTAHVAPSCAAASFQERAVVDPPAAPPSSLGNAAAGSAIGAAVSLLASKAISGLFNEFSNQTARREMLEVLEARANQELAARKYRRELVAALLDLRSFDELD
ncbi:hypothetical protein EDB84DRAFT_1219873 [Lactarius hengduanensis]|nr:hypothetical protein EDB84DRAFT_1219873 [Lactarius hengduanensis]